MPLNIKNVMLLNTILAVLKGIIGNRAQSKANQSITGSGE